MTFNSNPQTTEPAFLSHEKYIRQRPRGFHKSLNDCCYSLSNLALIVACVLAFMFSVKFLNDDPLYEYGEYLLSLKFYRYIIFILVILPLTLLVPLANAASVFVVNGSRKVELGSTVLGVRIFYQIVMMVLVFLGLVFIAPSIRHSSVANLMETEFKRHMKWRYDSEFSYEFLDRIQSEYQCCDELWYRSNFFDKLPSSCYQLDGTFSRIHAESCPETLGAMVSNRCIIIAASLVIIILSLALLVGMDVVELMSSSRHHSYNIREHETNLMKQNGVPETTSLSSRRNSRDEPLETRNEERNELVEELTNRLKMRERQREIPLLPKTTTTNPIRAGINRGLSSDDDDDDDHLGNQEPQTKRTAGEAILTRAKYHLYNNRPKSPVFVRTPDSGSLGDEVGQSSMSYLQPAQNANQLQQVAGTSPKSVLKKTSSFQTIDSDSDCEGGGGGGGEKNKDFGGQKQMQRDSQTRRSLLNVRFAD